jgi:hypothetical protein
LTFGLHPGFLKKGQSHLDFLPQSTYVSSVPSALLPFRPSACLRSRFRLRSRPVSGFPLRALSNRMPCRMFTIMPTMSSADFCIAVRESHDSLSPFQASLPWTRCRSPKVSLTAFVAHPPDLHSLPLMSLDFVTSCSLVRQRLPHIRFLFVESRLCSTLPSDPASRRRPCASLTLRPHQAV